MREIKLVLNCQPGIPAQRFNEALKSKGFNSLLLKEFLVERIKSGLVQADNNFYEKNSHLALDELLPSGIINLTKRKERVSGEIKQQLRLSNAHKTAEKRKKAKAKASKLKPLLTSLNSKLKCVECLIEDFQAVQKCHEDPAFFQKKLASIDSYVVVRASNSREIRLQVQLNKLMDKSEMEAALSHHSIKFSFSYSNAEKKQVPIIAIVGNPQSINTVVGPLADAFRALFRLPEVSSSSGSSHGNYGKPSFKCPEGYFDG